ncbi:MULTISPECIES: AraC family transcriptional regulator [unclassified Imperialibacter]|uniref:helix-turn-helix domain-containing protein n=1 Tax=unclassified Imperialibacter TaxID=2629706 RepID=UPI0012545DCC|nr:MULTISPECIES: helix-turn-helix transcriptional regulator [unclassified Imperialibacter]CAD5256194.1 Transcriptional regulator, AraC family [Imperialibacter sp. 89]CAD5262293.1 Transcriptional regulator, AraC family [Imperialibacter sp. 75]VVT33152.1 Transcriptional regulator, AraC family [Imperialibacter sp. EC-SDR9]
MKEIAKFETISQYNAFNNHETLHPLVSVIDFSKASPRRLRRTYFGFYLVLLKDVECGDMRYGKNTYDYQEGTLVFIGPGQVFGADGGEELYQPKGYGVVFHPDLVKGTSLGRHIDDYTFFSYQVSEALHISERERQLVLDSFSKVTYELEHAVDKHSRMLIAGNIELLLNYCVRFYDRQFITRDNVHKGVLERFEKLLHVFFSTNKSGDVGLPTVAYFAGELNLSPNYFGDLVKKESGKSAHEFIQLKLIDVAKERIFNPGKSVSEVAYELGFKYPQHFTRVFKQQVGVTPQEYRASVN